MQAMYKCRLCGETFGTFYCPKDTATRITYEYVCGLDPNKWLIGSRFYKKEVHDCIIKNAIGIGDFIGFTEEKLNNISKETTVKEGYLGYT